MLDQSKTRALTKQLTMTDALEVEECSDSCSLKLSSSENNVKAGKGPKRVCRFYYKLNKVIADTWVYITGTELVNTVVVQ